MGVTATKIGVITTNMGVIWGHQASHEFWERQNCIPPRALITDATPLINMRIVIIRLTDA